MNLKTLIRCLTLGGVFLLLDRFLKWQASGGLWERPQLLFKYFGWEPFFNKGIAFGIPVPKYAVFTLTAFIIISVFYFFFLNLKSASTTEKERSLLGLTLVMCGAASNFFDRFIFSHTIDYLRVLNGVINLADILIVVGFMLYFSSLKKT